MIKLILWLDWLFIAAVATSLCLIFFSNRFHDADEAVGVIGGADGPTAVFISTDFSFPYLILASLLIVLLLMNILALKKADR